MRSGTFAAKNCNIILTDSNNNKKVGDFRMEVAQYNRYNTNTMGITILCNQSGLGVTASRIRTRSTTR